MKAVPVQFVRIYITEADKLLSEILHYLHETIKVRGVTVLRGITGFGQSGAMHSSMLLSMSFDLPIIIEFFDTEEKVNQAIQYLTNLTGYDHIISTRAEMYE